MRIKNLEIEPVRYFPKEIYLGVGHSAYFNDECDQRINLKYPAELETRKDRDHYLSRLNEDYSMYLVEILFYATTKVKK